MASQTISKSGEIFFFTFSAVLLAVAAFLFFSTSSPFYQIIHEDMSNQYTPASEFEYHQITDNIYIGTSRCCTDKYNQGLVQEGITADFSLEEENIDAAYGAEYFVWIPVIDGEAPTQENFDFGVSSLEKLISLGNKVYVHCKEGQGRAPTMVAAYFIKTRGLTTDEAISFIQSKRPEASPNEAQIAALREYEKRIK